MKKKIEYAKLKYMPAASSQVISISTIGEILHEPLLILDKEYKIQFVNASFCQLFQVKKEDIEQQSFYYFHNKQWSLPQLHAFLEGVSLSVDRIPYHVEITQEFTNLGVKHLDITARAMQDTDGIIIVFLIADVTDGRQKENMFANWPTFEERQLLNHVLMDLQAEKEKIEHEKAKDEAIIESIGDGLIITGRDGNIIMVNKEAEKLLGWSKDELIFKFLSTVIHIEDAEGNTIPFEKTPISDVLSNAEHMINTTCYFRKKDNSRIPVALTVTPINLDTTIIGAVVVFRDITHEKEIDQMKTEFISLASHQLRTPLSAIKWFLEMLLAGDVGQLTQEQKDFIGNINHSNERMISLVSDLLNISRVESGRLIVKPVTTDLKELVSEIVHELQSSIDSKRQTVVITMQDNLPKINVDPKLIAQVYTNLLTNAMKYSPVGSKIEIHIFSRDNSIVSEVKDYGYGIPANEKDKLFRKFYRAENVVKMDTDGSGLGLYLAKTIVETSGGTIGFTSEENKGTTFWFALPLSGTQEKKGEVMLDIRRN